VIRQGKLHNHCGSSGPQDQGGAINLLVAISLGLLASLTSFYSARSVLVDRLASDNQRQATQARLAAEAALAWARADLQRQYADGPMPPTWGAGAGPNTTPCPAPHSGPRWQCVALQPPAHPGLPDTVVQVVAVRDLISSPHVTQLLASANLKDGTSRAQLQAQVFIPTVAQAPSQTNTAPVVLNACALAANNMANNGANLSTTRGTSGTAVGVCPNSSHLNNTPGTCTPSAWNSVLGDITPEQIRAWSEAQARNGLSALSQPTRSVYWVDSPAPWSQSLGTPEAPVLLVFSGQACAQRCPPLAPGVRVVGTVVLQTQCQDDKARAWHAGHIEGQLVVESGLPELQSGSRIEARELTASPHRLPWPAGIDARRVQRVPGSWREGGP
jgi:Tfp pilus assembly protein PilX